MATTIPLGSVALALARAGMHVHPLAPGGKHPATRRGFLDATRDPRRIRAWWAKAPNMNVGIAAGPSGLVVIDADHGKPWHPDWGEQPEACRDGADVLLGLAQQHGDTDPFIGPKSCNVATPSGGMHFFFRPPPRGAERLYRSGAGVLPWVDVRAHGGYVVAPYSSTPAGEYRPGAGWHSVITTDAIDFQPSGVPELAIRAVVPTLPGWLAGLLPVRSEKPAQSQDALDMVRRMLDAPRLGSSYAATALSNEAALVANAVQGQRNSVLHRAAVNIGTLVGAGAISGTEATARLLAAAETCGLDHAEASATIRSGLKYGTANPRTVSVL